MSRFFKKQQELFDTAVVQGKMFLILHSLSVVKEKSTDPWQLYLIYETNKHTEFMTDLRTE